MAVGATESRRFQSVTLFPGISQRILGDFSPGTKIVVATLARFINRLTIAIITEQGPWLQGVLEISKTARNESQQFARYYKTAMT
jgi:hypothetical protein